MTNIPKVALVILNWNGVKYLRQFLPPVLNSTLAQSRDHCWLTMASTDGSTEFLKQNFPSVKVIQNDKNYGFTGGYNKVLESVDADYFILLNSDVEVADGWIEPVIALMESDPMIAAAAPEESIAFGQNQTISNIPAAAGGFIDKFGYPFCQGRIFYEMETDKGQYNRSKEVFWATGAALVY